MIIPTAIIRHRCNLDSFTVTGLKLSSSIFIPEILQALIQSLFPATSQSCQKTSSIADERVAIFQHCTRLLRDCALVNHADVDVIVDTIAGPCNVCLVDIDGVSDDI